MQISFKWEVFILFKKCELSNMTKSIVLLQRFIIEVVSFWNISI